jgi:hypothetical protein
MRQGVVALRRRYLLLLVLTAIAGGCRDRQALTYAPRSAPPPRSESVQGQPAFTGHWAAATTACGHEAWTLDTSGMVSPGVLSCSFDKVTPTDAGYTADGVCEVGKAREPGRLVLTLTGRGASRSLTLDGGPFTEPVALVRCPSGPGARVQADSDGASHSG